MADNRSIFEILINHPKIDVDIQTNEQHTPLYYALLKYEAGDNNDDSYAAVLIKNKKAQTNPIYTPSEDSLLQVLITNEAENAALFLLDFLDDLDHINANGESALHVACKKNCATLVGKLLEMGADANLFTNELRQTPLHYCVLSNAAICIKAFIKQPDRVNFNARDSNGDTPISLALNEGFNELVPVLIEGKADVNVRNRKDFTLLHQAILKEDSKTAIFLLDNGADINAQ